MELKSIFILILFRAHNLIQGIEDMPCRIPGDSQGGKPSKELTGTGSPEFNPQH